MKLRRILSLILACSLAVTMFTVIPAAAADTVITQDNPSGTLTITLKIKGTASVTTAPTAKEGLTTSNGAAVELLENPGTAEGGTMAYSLNGTDYSADIPSADAAGTYTVYYKAIGDEDHNDSEAQTLTVTVGASGALTITLTITPDDVVSNQINALPAKDDVTLDDKADIEAARAAYDDLTDDQKAKVDAETLKKLTDAETALAAAEKKAAEEKAAKELAAAKNNAKKAMNNQVTVTQKGKKITVKWSKSTAADGYQVFVQYCGKKTTKPVKTIKKNTTTKVNITKINGKKINLKKQFNCQLIVISYQKDKYHKMPRCSLKRCGVFLRIFLYYVLGIFYCAHILVCFDNVIIKIKM